MKSLSLNVIYTYHNHFNLYPFQSKQKMEHNSQLDGIKMLLLTTFLCESALDLELNLKLFIVEFIQNQLKTLWRTLLYHYSRSDN
jgi:hypothetical protein